MNRRGFLGGLVACAAGALAGCAGPGARLELSRATDADLAERASTSAADAPPKLRSVVAEAVENGSATADEPEASFDPDRPVAFEGGYYEVTRTVVDEREERSWTIEVDFDPPADAEGATIAFADLPAVDRRVLGGLVPPPVDHPENEGFDVGVGGHVYGSEGEAESVLVPEQQYEFVTHEGERYRLGVDGPRTVTIETYRYEAEQVAASLTAYAEWVRAAYLFVLDGLSDAERDVVESAIEGGYHADEPSDAFASLEARFREQPGFDVGEYGGEWVVEYEGATYWADLYVQGD